MKRSNSNSIEVKLTDDLWNHQILSRYGQPQHRLVCRNWNHWLSDKTWFCMLRHFAIIWDRDFGPQNKEEVRKYTIDDYEALYVQMVGLANILYYDCKLSSRNNQYTKHGLCRQISADFWAAIRQGDLCYTKGRLLLESIERWATQLTDLAMKNWHRQDWRFVQLCDAVTTPVEWHGDHYEYPDNYPLSWVDVEACEKSEVLLTKHRRDIVFGRDCVKDNIPNLSLYRQNWTVWSAGLGLVGEVCGFYVYENPVLRNCVTGRLNGELIQWGRFSDSSSQTLKVQLQLLKLILENDYDLHVNQMLLLTQSVTRLVPVTVNVILDTDLTEKILSRTRRPNHKVPQPIHHRTETILTNETKYLTICKNIGSDFKCRFKTLVTEKSLEKWTKYGESCEIDLGMIPGNINVMDILTSVNEELYEYAQQLVSNESYKTYLIDEMQRSVSYILFSPKKKPSQIGRSLGYSHGSRHSSNWRCQDVYPYYA